MTRIASFAAGVVTGWIARSTVDTSRDAFVRLVALGYAAAERVRRIFALEREWRDDLAAEAKERARSAAETRHDGAPQPEHAS